MPPHSLTNFEIQNYYQNEPKLNALYSGNNLTKLKNGAYLATLDEFKSRGTHWKAFYVDNSNVIYFDNYGVENIPKEVKKFIGNKNIIKYTYRIQAYDSITCRYFCIGFIDFMLKCYTNLLSPNDCEKNDKIILKYFQ